MHIKNLHKQVITLGVISFFTDIASEMLYPVTPIFLTTVIGTSMVGVGLIEGLAEITAGFLKGFFGKLSDKLGKRSIFVVIGYSLSAISKPLPGLFPKFALVLSTRILDRIGKGVRTAPRDALLAGYSKGNSGEVFGFHRTMDTLGAALGPLLAIILLYFMPGNYQAIYLAAFIPSILAVFFTLKIKDKRVETKIERQNPNNSFWKSAPVQYKKFLVLFTTFSFVNSSDVFLILKSKEIARSEIIAIAAYIFYNLVFAAFSYPAGILSDKFGKKKIMIFGMLVFSIVYVGFAFSNHIVLIFTFFTLYGIYAASIEGISKAWIADQIPDQNRGSAIGLLTMLSSFSILIGSVLTGFLWDQFGSVIPFIASSVISLLVAIMLYYLIEN